MKRKISIFSVAISVLLLLVFATLPHHHHDEMACVIMEFCEQDNAVNDEHTNHNQTAEKEHNENCISEAKFVVPTLKDEIKSKVSSCKDYNHNDISSFPTYFIIADLINFDTRNYLRQREYREHLYYLKISVNIKSHGLRAPPAILS